MFFILGVNVFYIYRRKQAR